MGTLGVSRFYPTVFTLLCRSGNGEWTSKYCTVYLLKWATVVWNQSGKNTASFDHFLWMFKQVFNHTLENIEAGEQMFQFCSENKKYYALNSHTLAAGSLVSNKIDWSSLNFMSRVQIKHSDKAFIVSTSLDSGPAGNFMDHITAEEY